MSLIGGRVRCCLCSGKVKEVKMSPGVRIAVAVAAGEEEGEGE
jgi:hypothetical protein